MRTQTTRRALLATVTLVTAMGLSVGALDAAGDEPAPAAGPSVTVTARTSGTTSAATAAPASVTRAATAPYTPRNGITFNNPKGTRAQQLAIITQLDRAIEAAPRGSTIHAAQYHFNISSTANRLVAAHKRGVNVRLLIDDGFRTSQVTALRKALGTDRRKRSFVATCSRSCMTEVPSVMHAKFFVFSASGRARQVAMISSANVYTDNTFTSWNNLHTIVGDARLYGSLVRYFTDMVPDRNNPAYYRTTSSGRHKLYLFPRAPRAGADVVLMRDVLDNVACTGVARGYGRNGRTEIRVAMWGWSAARTNLAQRLWQLHHQGCRVEVILNRGTAAKPVLAALLKRSTRHGVMPVHDAWYDRNRDGKAELYVHHKVTTINGRWFGQGNTKVVYTGSQNFTSPGTRSNNDLVLRVKDDATLNAYSRNLNLIRDRYTKKLMRP